MSIRFQIALLLVAVSTLFVGSTWLMQQLVIQPAFADLERQSVMRDVERCINAIRDDLDSISTLAGSYAAADDTYEYALKRNESYYRSRLTDAFFETTSSNFGAILNPQQDVLWTSAFEAAEARRLTLAELREILHAADHGMAEFSSSNEIRAGLIQTGLGPMLIVSRPIVTSQRNGPIRGAFLMGRLVDSGRIKGLKSRTRLDLNLWSADSRSLPSDAIAAMGSFASHDEVLIRDHDASSLAAYTRLNDVYGKPAFLVRIAVPRTITQQGQSAANAANMCSLGGGLLTVLVTGVALRLRVVKPLRQMANHAIRVGVNDDLDARLLMDRTDEIGTLARSFDHMVERLAESRAKILESAHRAGKAEIASEVLHNVGNAVNSANSCAELVEERLTGSALNGLKMATGLLQEQAPRSAEFFTTDPRGPKLIQYFCALNDTLHQERDENLGQIRRLHETICHIRGVIHSQQQHAGRSDFRQRVSFRELQDEALLVNSRLVQESGVQVVTEMPEELNLNVNRSRLAQVLVNLQKNAILSMQSVPGRPHVLTISAEAEDDGSLRIRVQDTGIGISEAVRSRLFTQGFSTRGSGNGSGQGLHYCANVISEMGGRISAENPRIGHGAVFTIVIPNAVDRVDGTGVAIHEEAVC